MVSCKQLETSNTNRDIENIELKKYTSFSKLTKIVNDDLKLNRLASNKQIFLNDDEVYSSKYVRKNIEYNFIFNKNKQLLKYSKRHLLSAIKFCKLKEGIAYQMPFNELFKLYPTKDGLIPLMPEFSEDLPINTVCFLYHYKNLTFEFDKDKKLYSVAIYMIDEKAKKKQRGQSVNCEF